MVEPVGLASAILAPHDMGALSGSRFVSNDGSLLGCVKRWIRAATLIGAPTPQRVIFGCRGLGGLAWHIGLWRPSCDRTP